MRGPNYSHSSVNVVFDIRRFDTNMESGRALMSIVSPAFLAHQSFRGKVHRLHTDLSGAHDNSAPRITIMVNRLLCAGCIAERDSRVVSATKMSRFFSRVHDVEEANRTCETDR